MRAYLIEPQKIFVPYLTGMLRAAGIDVVGTSDEVDGHDLTSQAPDLIFVDIDFFERGGPSMLCRIREVARRATIIAISDTEDATFEASCYISGANALVAKSSSPETLVKTMRSLGLAPAAWPFALSAQRGVATRVSADEPRSRA